MSPGEYHVESTKVDDPREYGQTVRLVSHEGQEFIIERSLLAQSKVLATLLDPTLGFAESQTGVIRLKDIPARIVKRLVEYLVYRSRFDGSDDVPFWEIRVEESLDLLLAADYLEM